ncbi:UNVERIFIED_CONTAM: hypothetical protein GTU68_008306 [Idotea baltica]|nr:hypothetical protein [Idotea baltica]
MTFGGTIDACAVAKVTSIGKLGVKENKEHSAAISEFVEKHLAIPRSRQVFNFFISSSLKYKVTYINSIIFFFFFRMYIMFYDKPASEVGYDGTTFHEILAVSK